VGLVDLYAIAASWWLASHRTTTASHGACSPHRIFLKKCWFNFFKKYEFDFFYINVWLNFF
jgi:hypothetical protein